MAKEFELTAIAVEYFRRLQTVSINLGRLNVLVGGNNAGKSSFLQAIHFGVSVATAARSVSRETFTQDTLLYCPSSDFTQLRHGDPYQNQSRFGTFKFTARNTTTASLAEYRVSVYRAKNAGNVGCRRIGDLRLGQTLTDATRPFSVYVPGLAGVPRVEEFRSEGVVRRGVAGGDANLYLRNVLFLIKRKGKLPGLLQHMRQVFPGFTIEVSFDNVTDVEIGVRVSTKAMGGRLCPIDLAGTGVLQALQIFSYITLFEPSVLLLDEPDSHLHPSNQVLLARALVAASKDFETQIIVSTHSRHLVDALRDEAHFVWLKDGSVAQQGKSLPLLALLMDLGAIDGFDRVRNGEVDWFILSEDTDMSMLSTLFGAAGFTLSRCEFRSYSTSSRMEAALELAAYINEVAPRTQVIIHRDRDCMTATEVVKIEEKIKSAKAIPFITRNCDVESYFVEPEHIAITLGTTNSEAAAWVEAMARHEHVALQHAFMRKRDEIKNSMYRGRTHEAPDTLTLCGTSIPLPIEFRLGKEMLRRCRSALQIHKRAGDLTKPTESLDVSDLISLRTNAQAAAAAAALSTGAPVIVTPPAAPLPALPSTAAPPTSPPPAPAPPPPPQQPVAGNAPSAPNSATTA